MDTGGCASCGRTLLRCSLGLVLFPPIPGCTVCLCQQADSFGISAVVDTVYKIYYATKTLLNLATLYNCNYTSPSLILSSLNCHFIFLFGEYSISLLNAATIFTSGNSGSSGSVSISRSCFPRIGP